MRKLRILGLAWVLVTLVGASSPKQHSGKAHDVRDANGFITAEELLLRTKAAYGFADRLVGIKSPKFFGIFMQAYNVAARAEDQKEYEEVRNVGSWNVGSKFLEREDFLAAQKRIVVEAGLAPEQLSAPDVEECVALLKGGKVCCSGILVGKSSVLTAGHCASSCNDTIRLVSQAGPAVDIDINKPASAFFQGLDLAIVKLNSSTAFPRATLADDIDMRKLDIVSAVGFGATGHACSSGIGTRRKAPLPVIAEECDAASMQVYDCKSGEFVAGSSIEGVCPSDSGGAAFLQNGHNRVLAGIIVDQVPGADFVGRFVRMDKDVRKWVEAN
jgi:hypothetical protein